MGKRGPKAKDLTGQKFGKLTVLEMLPSAEGYQNRPRVRCRCDCGNSVVALTSNVVGGVTKSCGCIRSKGGDPSEQALIRRRTVAANKEKIKENGGIVGLRFGRLTVVADCGANAHGERLCECVCDCGKDYTARRSKLINGNTTSCGCYLRDSVRARALKDGSSRAGSKYRRLYNIWANMKERCTNPKYHRYCDYGGRGITLDPAWNDWLSFKDWALTHGYDDELTIDRIDNDSGYRPGNCRWIPSGMQQNNTRRTVRVFYQGRCYSSWQFHRLTGVPYDVVLGDASQGLFGEEILLLFEREKTGEHSPNLHYPISDNVHYVR